ncbi:MAG: Ig-like domain-containing protein, partial [Acidimicrobiales bacterium]
MRRSRRLWAIGVGALSVAVLASGLVPAAAQTVAVNPNGRITAPAETIACRLFPIAISVRVFASVAPGATVADVMLGSAPGNFGWLSWTGTTGLPALIKSLTLPGDGETYTSPDNPLDRVLSVGDLVRGRPGVANSSNVREALDKLKDVDIVVPLWAEVSGTGSNVNYRVSGFAVVRIVEHRLPDNKITVRLVARIGCEPTPAGQDTKVTTAEDIPVAIALSASSLDPADISFTVTPPSHGSLGPISAPACSRGIGFVLNTLGIRVVVASLTTCTAQVVYTPNPDYNGPDSFTYEGKRGSVESAPATVSITVTPVNDPPVANPDSKSTDQDKVLTIPAAELLANDTPGPPDEATQTLRIDSVSKVETTVGEVSLASGTVTYTPRPRFNGTDSFRYRVCDDGVTAGAPAPRCAEAAVNVTVRFVNRPPVATDATESTNEDTPKTLALGATDPESDPLSFFIVSAPARGRLSGTGPTRTYTPDSDSFGPDSFTFKANDGALDSNVATVTISVRPVNDGPVATMDEFSATAGTALVVAAPGVLSNDSDADGDALTAQLVAGASHGMLEFGADGGFTYTAAAGFSGDETFKYRACDPSSACSEPAVVTIHVRTSPSCSAGPAPSGPPGWSATASMADSRVAHAAVELADGSVLAVSGWLPPTLVSTVERYCPASGTWLPAGTLAQARSGHTASRLQDGRVIVVGGEFVEPAAPQTRLYLATTEIFDPASNTWAAGPSLNSARHGHTATLLSDGRVLVTGGGAATAPGQPAVRLASAEIFNPSTGVWSALPDMSTRRFGHVAVRLNDGRVLLAGGDDLAVANSSAELFDPTTNTFTPTGSMSVGRDGLAGASLPDGRVLVAGGGIRFGPLLSSAETYDPASGAWTAAGSLAVARAYARAALLPGGQILIVGGMTEETPVTHPTLASAEVFDAAAGAWATVPMMSTPRAQHTATALGNGTVLVTGGEASRCTCGAGPGLASAELFRIGDQPLPHRPSPRSDMFETEQDTALAVPLPGLLGNDTDADGDALTAALATGPSHGTVVVQPNGSFTFTPHAGYVGRDSFTYLACDPGGGCSQAPVEVRVTAACAAGRRSAFLDLTAVDHVANTATGTLRGVTVVLSGSEISENGFVIDGTAPVFNHAEFTPPLPAADLVQIRGRTGDAYRLTFSQPVANPTMHLGSLASTLTFTGITLGKVSGQDTFVVSGSTVSGVLDENPAFTDANGTVRLFGVFSEIAFTTRLDVPTQDNQGDGINLQIGVSGCGGPPIATGAQVTTAEDTPVAVTLTATDPDGDALTFTTTSPQHGTLSGTGNARTYTPAADFNGTDTFTFKANDGGTDSNIATVTIQVDPVNDPPVAGPNTYRVEVGPLVSGGPSVLYGVNSETDPDVLVTFDMQTGAATTVGTIRDASGTAINVGGDVGLAHDPVADRLYLVDGGFEVTRLMSVDPATGVTQLIGTGLGVDHYDPGLAFDPFMRRLYMITDSGELTVTSDHRLYEIDLASGVARFIGTVMPRVSSMDANVGLAFDWRTRRLLATFGNASVTSLYAIDINTAAATLIGSTGAVHLTGLDYDPLANMLYASDSQFRRLYAVDPMTGAATLIGTHGLGNVEGLAVKATPPSATTLRVAAPGVLGNDHDVEASALIAKLIAPPQNGYAVLGLDGSLTYTPSGSFSGVDTLRYAACDTSDACTETTVTITVAVSGQVNRPPLIMSVPTVSKWVNLTPPGTRPSPRSVYGAQAYDEVNDRIIVFSGEDNVTPHPHPADVWVLTNASGVGGTPAWVE